MSNEPSNTFIKGIITMAKQESHELDVTAYKADKENYGLSVGTNLTNVVSGDKLRAVQRQTLENMANYIAMTFGPMGSNTKIITGQNRESIQSFYSKDGLKVLKHVDNTGPIEAAIAEELIEMTRHVEGEVGDGTTSTVILSSIIFKKLLNIQKKHNIPPYQLIRYFTKVVNDIKEKIKEAGTECTCEDIYDISMISTNGNEQVSEIIRNIYDEYGMDVDLSVGISNTHDNIIKTYDGLTITEGFSDPAFVNNPSTNTAEIHNAHVYHFADPIDTMEMISYFETIVNHNIYDQIANDEDPIPTVITCPRLSRDMSATLKRLAQDLYQFNGANAVHKPPILVITNVVASDEVIMDDIANLCGCKSIRKYIDPQMKKKDQEDGKAPTLENVHEFCGKAELVVADAKKTKFINPVHMTTVDGELDPIYKALIHFLETEIANPKSTDTAGEIGVLKKRLAALRANMVEFLVGGITIAERDAVKDLVEDAIKNCRSAAKYGVGYAANFEGLTAAYSIFIDNLSGGTDIEKDISREIFVGYTEIAEILYKSIATADTDIESLIADSLRNGTPFNIASGEYAEGSAVKCSIMLDYNIIDTIAKIVTMMVTSNQCLLQAAPLNKY